jgi:RNA polymerase sigma-70 factor (ECF subfamily)
MYNQWRKKRAALTLTDAGLSDVAAPEQAADIGEVEFQQQLTIRALQLMQAEFQPTTWQACWETVVRGRSGADVARELGISVNAVYLARSRVLRRLREELGGMLD